MSASGQKQTLNRSNAMSALPPKADIGRPQLDVRFVPKAVHCSNRRQECACLCGRHLLLDDHRKRESERRALARLRLDPNPAPVHLNDALGYSESQAGAALLLGDGIVRLLELLKQPGLVRR